MHTVSKHADPGPVKRRDCFENLLDTVKSIRFTSGIWRLLSISTDVELNNQPYGCDDERV